MQVRENWCPGLTQHCRSLLGRARLLPHWPCPPNVAPLWQVFARSRKMVIPITHQSLVKNRDFNHSPITISNGDSNHSPITNQITLHNFLGSNFDYYISNKFSFSIITIVQSSSHSILTYFSGKYCLQSIIQGTEIQYLMQISVLDANFCTWRQSLSSRCLAAKKDKDLIETVR